MQTTGVVDQQRSVPPPPPSPHKLYCMRASPRFLRHPNKSLASVLAAVRSPQRHVAVGAWGWRPRQPGRTCHEQRKEAAVSVEDGQRRCLRPASCRHCRRSRQLPALAAAPSHLAHISRLAALDQQRGGGSSSSSAARSKGSLPRPGSGLAAQQAGGKRRRSGAGGPGGNSGSGAGAGERRQQQTQQQQQAPEPIYSRLDDAIAAGRAAEVLQLPRPEPNSQASTTWV